MKKFILTVVFILSSFCFANEKESDVAIVTEEWVKTNVFYLTREIECKDMLMTNELIMSIEEESLGYCHCYYIRWYQGSEYNFVADRWEDVYDVFVTCSCYNF